MPEMIKILTNTILAAVFLAVLVIVPVKAEAQELETGDELIVSIFRRNRSFIGAG